ncbi:MAG: amino acid ABC transporter substrate-binding protein [Alcaligenaceae bacterium]|nr:amino acid ABC transporter substrate-binding protein [Alcaligenaceae bacterium]
MKVLTKRFGILACSLSALALGAPGSAAAANDSITLGAVVSVTGEYATNGKLTRQGYDLAVERINSTGGIKVGDKTYDLKIKYYDDESTSARAAQLAERLIKQDGVKFVLGPYGSALTKAIAPVTEKYGVPMIEGNGAARELFQKGYKELFAVLNTSDFYLRPAVTLLAEQAKAAGKQPSSMKIAIATQNDNFSQDVRDGVLEEAKKYDMQIVVDDKLPRGLNDMTAILTKVKALKPDALLVSAHAHGGPLAIDQTAAQQVYVPMLALTHCKAGQIVKKYGDKANYALCASQWDSHLTYTGRWFKSASEFAKASEAKYGVSPAYQVAESAASVVVFADAFERAGSLDQAKVRDAIAATDMTTFYGGVKFDKTGKNIAKSMVMYQIQDQQYKVVAPTKWATTKLIYPEPQWADR